MALTEVNSLGIKDLEVKTADIAAANVTLAKVENVTDGQIIVGNGSNRPTAVAVSGDVTLANTGAVTIATGAVEHAMLAADCVDGDNIQDDVINSEHIAAGAVDLEHMSSESVDEDNLHVSNSPTNGYFLSAQSGNAGGLTWAEAGGGLDGVTTGSGNVTITDGNLIVADGHGIDFSATGDTSVTGTTSGAELLDDYEEGQWTPAIKVGGAGNVSISGSQDKGRYVKIGNFVTIWGYFQLSSKGSDNGDGHVAIDGVPYNSDQYGQPDRAAYSCGAQQWGNWSNVKCAGVVFGNNTTRCFPQGGDGSSHAYMTYNTNLNDDSFMGFEISYKTS